MQISIKLWWHVFCLLKHNHNNDAQYTYYSHCSSRQQKNRKYSNCVHLYWMHKIGIHTFDLYSHYLAQCCRLRNAVLTENYCTHRLSVKNSATVISWNDLRQNNLHCQKKNLSPFLGFLQKLGRVSKWASEWVRVRASVCLSICVCACEHVCS